MAMPQVRPLPQAPEEPCRCGPPGAAPGVEPGQVAPQPGRCRLAQQDCLHQVSQDCGEASRIGGGLAQSHQAGGVRGLTLLPRPVQEQAPGVFLGDLLEDPSGLPLALGRVRCSPLGGRASRVGRHPLGPAAQAEDQPGELGGPFRGTPGHEPLGDLRPGGADLDPDRTLAGQGQGDLDAPLQPLAQAGPPGPSQGPLLAPLGYWPSLAKRREVKRPRRVSPRGLGSA